MNLKNVVMSAHIHGGRIDWTAIPYTAVSEYLTQSVKGTYVRYPDVVDILTITSGVNTLSPIVCKTTGVSGIEPGGVDLNRYGRLVAPHTNCHAWLLHTVDYVLGRHEIG